MNQLFAHKLGELAVNEGPGRTHLDNVLVFRATQPYPRTPLVYDQCLCFVAQGHKNIHLTDRYLTYNADQFLVVPTIVPLECETFASPQKALLGMAVSIDFVLLQELLGQIGEKFWAASELLTPQPGVYLEPMTDDVLEPLLRLLECLKTKGDADILGGQILRELYYRVLLSEHGHILASAARGESAYARISQILRMIHQHYGDPMDVSKMAAAANMSLRSFHSHFKAVTSYTPVQYLKRIRLEKARQIIVNQGLQANVTAHMVGYESPSQFSREFKRHFGYPPREAAANELGYTPA